ncbi:MAG: hypothetical protein GWO02_14050 [Gammaproteobacteria bacterium]|nr:hypothetical protein [Gammaproteobacteria bacterium]
MGSRYNRGTWLGLVVALLVWQLVVRPTIVVTLGYESGLSLPLLLIAGAFGAVGAGVGTLLWRELRDGPGPRR